MNSEAKRLIDSGYRCTSNRHRMISRIDRPDWREYMGSRNGGGAEWVEALGSMAGDHYRRVYSQDILSGIPPAIYEQIKKAGTGSGWGGLNEYKEKVSASPEARSIVD